MPSDAFAATGQLWGNPTYRWNILADQGYLGGWNVFRCLLNCSIMFESIILEASKATMPFLPKIKPQKTAAGVKVPEKIYKCHKRQIW